MRKIAQQEQYTEENANFDFKADNIQAHLNNILADSKEDISELDFAIKAYYYVRDHWDYYPYRLSLRAQDWKASLIASHKDGHCIDKAVLLISLLRAKNIPARLGLAKVKNHIAVEHIVERFGNDTLVPHGYVEIFLNQKWVKATPAFNRTLCERLGVHTLEFDGENDSVFQAFDKSGQQSFMEYLEDYGTFDHVPLEYMYQLMYDTYPPFREQGVKMGDVLDLARL